MANKITEIKERVLQIAKYHGVSYEKFSNEIGMSYASFIGYCRLPAKDDRIISPKRGCGGCAGCCWQGGTRIKQPERFILTPDYPIKDAARPHNLDTTATTKRITKLDILLFHAFAE